MWWKNCCICGGGVHQQEMIADSPLILNLVITSLFNQINCCYHEICTL